MSQRPSILRMAKHSVNGSDIIEVFTGDGDTFIGAIYPIAGGIRLVSKHLPADASEAIRIDNSTPAVAIDIQIVTD